MNHMDRIRAEHDLAVMESRRQFEAEQERNERTIFAAVEECQALRAIPAWQLRDEYEALQEALFYLTDAIAKASGEVTQ